MIVEHWPAETRFNAATIGKARLPMTVPPAWQIESKGSETLLRLSGDWLLHDGGLQAPDDILRVVLNLDRSTRLRFDATSVAHWDSSLLAFV